MGITQKFLNEVCTELNESLKNRGVKVVYDVCFRNGYVALDKYVGDSSPVTVDSAMSNRETMAYLNGIRECLYVTKPL